MKKKLPTPQLNKEALRLKERREAEEMYIIAKKEMMKELGERYPRLKEDAETN